MAEQAAVDAAVDGSPRLGSTLEIPCKYLHPTKLVSFLMSKFGKDQFEISVCCSVFSHGPAYSCYLPARVWVNAVSDSMQRVQHPDSQSSLPGRPITMQILVGFRG